MDTDLADGHVWLYAWQESSTKTHVCVRAEGPANVGGRLSLDTTGTPGVSPVVQTSTNPSEMNPPCTHNVVHLDSPVGADVRRSATEANPASICVNVSGNWLRVTVGSSGSPLTPSPTWNPDPGTPG